jgi:hypothetical protein
VTWQISPASFVGAAHVLQVVTVIAPHEDVAESKRAKLRDRDMQAIARSLLVDLQGTRFGPAGGDQRLGGARPLRGCRGKCLQASLRRRRRSEMRASSETSRRSAVSDAGARIRPMSSAALRIPAARRSTSPSASPSPSRTRFAGPSGMTAAPSTRN